jgi:hypothetical protein
MNSYFKVSECVLCNFTYNTDNCLFVCMSVYLPNLINSKDTNLHTSTADKARNLHYTMHEYFLSNFTVRIKMFQINVTNIYEIYNTCFNLYSKNQIHCNSRCLEKETCRHHFPSDLQDSHMHICKEYILFDI